MPADDMPMIPNRRRSILVGPALVLALAAASPPISAIGDEPLPAATLGDGLVVWESNRQGEFRLVARDLRSRDARLLTGDEPGRDHCCAAISPDGRTVAYLSLPAGRGGYFDGKLTGEVRLHLLDGGAERRLVSAARTYGEHRAFVWLSERDLVFIDGSGTTQRLDVVSGRHRPMLAGARTDFGWLVDPTGRWATTGDPTFSRIEAKGSVVPAPRLGGCQPVFSGDGRFGVWSAGAGGPIARLDLSSRRISTLLRRNDPRVPEGFGYLYFPNLERRGAALAFAASRGEHDHFTADYEVFVVSTDPVTLAPRGQALRISAHPGVDRFPDVWLAPGERLGLAASESETSDIETVPAEPSRSSWPATLAGLALLWPDGDRFGAVLNQGKVVERGDLLVAEGFAWLDRRGRMSLGGGRFFLPPELAAQVNDALRDSNELTLELEVEPWSVAAATRGPVVALANAPGSRSFAIHQEGERLLLVLRTSDTGRAGGEPVEIGRLVRGKASHLVIAFTPGRLSAWVDGTATVEDRLLPGDFFHWNAVHLSFGGEERGQDRWRGWLAGVRIAAVAASADEAKASSEGWRRERAMSAPVERRRVIGRVVGRSAVPGLESIAPYREALVVQEIEVAGSSGGSPARLRVARWGLVDGAATSASRAAAGDAIDLLVEPIAGNARAESLYLADTLTIDPESSLWLDVGLDVSSAVEESLAVPRGP